MRPIEAVLPVLLLACSHGEPVTPAPAATPVEVRHFVDVSRPRRGVRGAELADVANAMNAQYRITPDRRALIAIADLHELLQGKRVEPELDFVDGKWTIKGAGTLPEIPRFADLLELLTKHAAALGARAATKTAPITVFDAPAAFTAAKTIPKTDAANLARAAIAINMQTVDRLGLADRLRARALALLAMAGKNAELDGERAILADVLGYETEARELASRVPADAPARAWVLRTAPVQRGELATYIAARNAIRNAKGTDRAEVAFKTSERLPARALPLLLDNTAFGHAQLFAGAAAQVIAAEVAGDAAPLHGTAADVFGRVSEPDLRRSLSIFETALPNRATALASPTFPREVVQAHYEALFHSAAHELFTEAIDRYASREASADVLKELDGATTPVAKQVAEWMRLTIAAEYERGRGTNAQQAVAAIPLLGGATRAELLDRFSDAVGTYDRHVHLALHDLFPRLDTRPAEMLLAGQKAHSILGDPMRRDRYMPAALEQSISLGNPGLAAWYYVLAGDEPRLRAIATSADARPSDRAVALGGLGKLTGADHAWVTREFEKLLYAAGHDGTYSAFVDYINERRDWKTKERVIRQWMTTAKDAEATTEAYYAASLGKTLEAQGRYDEAWKIVEPHVGVFSGTILSSAVSLLDRRGKIDEAIDLGTQMIARYPDNARTRVDVARIHWRRGRHAEAAKLLDPKQRYSSNGLRIALAEAFIDTFEGRPKEEAIAAYTALTRGGLEYWVASQLAFDIQKQGNAELAFELLAADAVARNLEAETTDGANTYVSTWHALKEWKGLAAANEWIRPHLQVPALIQVGVIAYQNRAFELLFELPPHPDLNKNVQILSLRTMALLHTRAAADDPRRVATAQKLTAIGDAPETLATAARYLLDLVDEETYLRGVKNDEDSKGTAAYFVGLKAASRGDYDKALPWLIYASEGRESNAPRAWAMAMLWRWAGASKPWPEIKRSGVL